MDLGTIQDSVLSIRGQNKSHKGEGLQWTQDILELFRSNRYIPQNRARQPWQPILWQPQYIWQKGRWHSTPAKTPQIIHLRCKKIYLSISRFYIEYIPQGYINRAALHSPLCTGLQSCIIWHDLFAFHYSCMQISEWQSNCSQSYSVNADVTFQQTD